MLKQEGLIISNLHVFIFSSSLIILDKFEAAFVNNIYDHLYSEKGSVIQTSFPMELSTAQAMLNFTGETFTNQYNLL
jgi:hypothetical protein